MDDEPAAVIAWGGDVNLGRRQHYRTAQLSGPAIDVPALRDADLTLVNLECVVSTRGTLGVRKGEAAPYYFRARPQMLGILQDAKVDVVATANNHSGDYGPEALLDQARWLSAAGIGSVGSGLNEKQAFAPIFRNAGPRVAAIFAVDATQRMTAAGPSTAGQAHIPMADLPRWTHRMSSLMAHARQFADVVLVALHAGPNFASRPSPGSAAIAHALVDAGADAVLGSSAHVLQGVELYKGRPIVHDAGDLLFDALSRPDNDGGVFLLHLGPAGIERIVFTPVHVGFGHTRQRSGDEARAASRRFIEKSAALGTAFSLACDGTAVLEIARTAASRPRAAPSRAETVPDAEWTASVVPQDAALAQPCTLGPLRLLGVRASPLALDRRRMVYVESFWTSDAAIPEDWRIEIRAKAMDGIDPPMVWGASSEHDPCDWMWPTSKWRPGLIYRDHYGLRPPAESLLRPAALALEVRAVGPARRCAWVPLPLRIELALAHLKS